MTEDLAKYNGLTVRFTGMVNINSRFPEGCFVVGRKIMTCCEADITYSGMIAEWAQRLDAESQRLGDGHRPSNGTKTQALPQGRSGPFGSDC